MKADVPHRDARLAAFAADALDWHEVLALFTPFTRSALGRRALSELGPRDDDDAVEALARLAEMLEGGAAGAEPPLGGVSDVPALFARLDADRRALSGEELAGVTGFLRACKALREWLAERRGAAPALARLAARITDLAPLRAELEAGLDARGEPRDEASAELARLRREARRLTAEIERRLREIARRAPSALADGHQGQVHPRHGRATLAVKAGHLGQVPGAVLDRSASGETLFVEPRELADLGNELVSLRADEAREASRLFAEWTRAVLARRGPITASAAAIAEVELAVVGRDMARASGGRAAALPGRGGADELVLRSARHPVLAAQEREGKIPRVVPLDLRLGGEFDQLLVTGPNTGGKTLVLKTVGVCVLLTRAGLPILAEEGSTVPLYRGIAADIGDEQEVAQSLSTFASHVKRLAAGLARARPDVLFLLDEVGGATDPAEGVALGEALLERLLALRVPTIATTHLAGLVEFAWRHARVENASVEFDVATLAPTYRLRVGTPGSSQALVIARRLGLPEELVERARARVAKPDDDVAAVIREVGAARVAAEDARVRAEAQRAEVAQRERELAAAEAAHAAREASLLAEIDGELERRIARCRHALDAVLAVVPQVAAPVRAELESKLDALASALAACGLSAYREAFFAKLKKGDPVWLPRYGRRCPVVRVDPARRRLVVRLGQRDVELGFEDAAAFEAL